MSKVSMVMGKRAVAAAGLLLAMPVLCAQTAAPHQSGTVKSTAAGSLTLTTAAGQDVAITVPDTAKILVVPPGSKDLKSASAGSAADIATGDKVIVTGTPGDTTALTATRVILMKSDAIAQAHAAEDAAWAAGGGGIVKSVDAAAGKIVVSHGLKLLTVVTTPATIIRRYSGDSVKFSDAQVSTLAAVRPGDQLRVRGAKSADGNTITADELVTGTFHNYSGLIASIDSAAETVTLKDLTTKKMVTVAVTANSDVHRIPAAMAAGIALRMKGAGAAPASGSAPSAATGPDSTQRAGRAGTDLSQMMARLPTETLGGLKPGDSVMIVATSPSADSVKSTAVTLLVGVEAILTAPSGQSATLTPWSLGGGGEEGAAASQ
jgi:co-chaperonin GroES (HSP10)